MTKEYTVREVSNMLNSFPETISRYIREGRLKAYKKPGDPKWHIVESDLQSFVDNDAIFGPRYSAYKKRLEAERLKETDPKTYYRNKMNQAMQGIEEMQKTLDRYYRKLQRILSEEEA